MYPLCIESSHPQPKVRPSHLPTSVSKKKKLSKWNRTPKGSSIFGNARAYLLVGTIVTIVYRVMSSSTKSTTLAFTDIGFQKIFQNRTERRKACQFLGNARAYLFVGTIVTVVYRVKSSSAKSTTLAFTDIGSLQKFSKKMGPHAERLVGF
jgi:hypothetical protein